MFGIYGHDLSDDRVGIFATDDGVLARDREEAPSNILHAGPEPPVVLHGHEVDPEIERGRRRSAS
jgi:hypothetical protein